MGRSFRFDARERVALEENGFVVRDQVFDRGECRAIAADCEALVELVTAEQRRTKHVVGSYMFELQRKLGTVIKWEPDAPELVQGLEPFAHLSTSLNDWGMDARLLEPAKDVVGEEDLVLFTEKLNLKRAQKGGPIILHQDFPYWEPMTPIASRIATAMLFLDDATLENGCLEVAPGSHRNGKEKQRASDGFGSLEMDPDQYDQSRLVPFEAKAGTVAYFGAFLVHRSLPNRSGADRRALLYSYQPAGYPHARELNKLVARAPA
jgi:hypothetical protein